MNPSLPIVLVILTCACACGRTVFAQEKTEQHADLLSVAMAKVATVIALLLFPLVGLAAPLAQTDFDVIGDYREHSLEFSVEKPGAYAVQVDYYYADEGEFSRDRVWRAAGGRSNGKNEMPDKPGASFDIDTSIIELKGGRKIYRSYIRRPILSSWGDSSLHAELFRLSLIPGEYKLLVRRVGESQALAGVVVKISVVDARRGK
ncbi:transporter [Pseudomonas syringae pv. actinidifoliorum]|nr:transporter [Pseudomonas syringae pv. actinidifoliorum]MDU8519842.1 transporter [Pseudomonas syringae pv. actinidifoliorum]MDU8527548.1 transporter [Pseudomonas syringae pv. actinidifoliorum]